MRRCELGLHRRNGFASLVDRAHAFAHLAATAKHRLDPLRHAATLSRRVSIDAARRFRKRSQPATLRVRGLEWANTIVQLTRVKP